MASSRKRFGLPVAVALFALVILSLFAGCGKSAPAIEMVRVPELAGMERQEAAGVLEAAGLQAGEVREIFDDAVPPGMVISATPDSGELEEGSAVDLTVSKGPELVALPSLLGKAEAEAIAALQAQGFQVEVVRDYNESVTAGAVCAMEPAPDTAVARGSLVTVTVSLGSAYVTCGTCNGSGTVSSSRTCPDCGGTGVCYT
jgi:serine/threonine-protein kinase